MYGELEITIVLFTWHFGMETAVLSDKPYKSRVKFHSKSMDSFGLITFTIPGSPRYLEDFGLEDCSRISLSQIRLQIGDEISYISNSVVVSNILFFSQHIWTFFFSNLRNIIFLKWVGSTSTWRRYLNYIELLFCLLL